MKKNQGDITLIVPCYNEEINIQKGVLDRIGNYTRHNADFLEVLIVDDGSSDKSKKIIKEKYLPEFKKFKLIENNHQGKAFAIITGVQHSKGTYTMFSDIDLATPIEESEKLIRYARKGYDVVIGSRKSSREGAPLSRKLMAVGFIFIRNTLIGLQGIRDTQCGFKLFNTKKALHIIDKLVVFKQQREIHGSSVSAGFDLEFLFVAKFLSYKIKEVPVVWKHVETKNVHFLADSLETLKDICRIKWYEITQRYS